MLRNALPLFVLLCLLAVLWQVVKLLGGPVTGGWVPPFKFQFATDLNMPNLAEIAGAFSRPASRGGPPLLQVLAEGAFFTFRVALTGFGLGSATGLLLASTLIHSRRLSRAVVPFVVASQTVPILVVAPMVVIWLRAGWFSIAIIAAYLSFFPVTVSALRGLNSVRPEALELFTSYAASPLQIYFKLRLPTALPYLFIGFKIAATASIVGTIVGELPSGITEGLGSLILTFAQYYSTGPAKLWACIVVAAILGIGTFSLVQIAERIAFRKRTGLAV